MTFNSTITNPTDINILRAFIWALAQLDHRLSDDLQNQLNQISKELGTNATQAVANLYKIAQSASEIKDFYEKGSEALGQEYDQQERGRVITLTVDSSNEETGEVGNVSRSTDALVSFTTDAVGSLKLCQHILAQNSVENAQQVPAQLQSERGNIDWSLSLLMHG